MSFGGTINVDNSNVGRLQNIENVENFNYTLHIHQGNRQNIQVTNSTIDNNATTYNSATTGSGKFTAGCLKLYVQLSINKSYVYNLSIGEPPHFAADSTRR